MDQLIEAFGIFRKYTDAPFPTNCEHDELRVMVEPSIVTPEDTRRLDELGFFPDTDNDECFISFRFGSC